MGNVVQLNTVEDWQSKLRSSSDKPVFVFKHSTRCPVSADAYDQYMIYMNREPNPEVEYCLVHVVESRPVSNAISEALSLKHESPQAILIKDGKVAWHTSHWRITKESLKENLK
ncbi:bacillithiol system protein YtxJ [Chlamydia abortus]|uniref:Bacillithiol system redox-active protein YtxJ n=1 Tax=Paenibacillus residui TaxID=629724 RepID=A0ABW3DB79_9BACL|nr:MULTISPECIES: bacillithiol system redox-active protein YtxJ [Paenibacillaceae]SHE11560.1 bacillithiol system protein YtxJ [Chlamydia abortus]